MYNEMAIAAMQREDFDRAAEILRFPIWKSAPPDYYFATRARLAARVNDAEAWTLADTMRSAGHYPDVNYYQNVVRGFIEASDFDQAIKVLHFMREKEGLVAGRSFYDQFFKHLTIDPMRVRLS